MFHIRALGHQELGHVEMSVFRSGPQREGNIVGVPLVHIRALGQKKYHHVEMVLLSGRVEQGGALVQRVDVVPLGDEPRRHVALSEKAGDKQVNRYVPAAGARIARSGRPCR